MKMIWKVIAALICLGIIITAALGLTIYNFAHNSKVQKSDCIVVLGCSVYGETPSPFLKWRTDEAYRLYKEGYGKYIIASGGKGPGENISEAEAVRRYLMEKGMDEKNIIKEEASTSTMENLDNCKDIMDNMKFNTAIVVSNNYHLKRASLMTKKVNIKASFSGVYVTPYKSHETYGFIREIPALLKFYILRR
ncbi:YdcF family protein [Clostridium rectalis]|uniref:YdcF family protein n=1 Tax=Clostridium rectalis TaxID=2040295 RepID=UPI000F6397B6|nr:YdcF family protein [Clostridium rectalis]